MTKILKASVGLCALLAAPGWAQNSVQINVTNGRNMPVPSTIQFRPNQSSGWQIVAEAATGRTSIPVSCTLGAQFLADPIDVGYTNSRPTPCTGPRIDMVVQERDLSLLPTDRMLSRYELAEIVARAEVQEDLSLAASSEQQLVQNFVGEGEQSEQQRDRAGTLILNDSSMLFGRIDRDGSGSISASEVQTAAEGPE